ncbi:MAG: DUF433 domain-containing protein [Thioalkalivibrio sp.]|nr:DUF433 domain-containing protein [Thioalkalivibrio sp.]
MNQTPVVHSHPEIVSGEPVFIGTRVPARNLLEWLEGDTRWTSSWTTFHP